MAMADADAAPSCSQEGKTQTYKGDGQGHPALGAPLSSEPLVRGTTVRDAFPTYPHDAVARELDSQRRPEHDYSEHNGGPSGIDGRHVQNHRSVEVKEDEERQATPLNKCFDRTTAIGTAEPLDHGISSTAYDSTDTTVLGRGQQANDTDRNAHKRTVCTSPNSQQRSEAQALHARISRSHARNVSGPARTRSYHALGDGEDTLARGSSHKGIGQGDVKEASPAGRKRGPPCSSPAQPVQQLRRHKRRRLDGGLAGSTGGGTDNVSSRQSVVKARPAIASTVFDDDDDDRDTQRMLESRSPKHAARRQGNAAAPVHGHAERGPHAEKEPQGVRPPTRAANKGEEAADESGWAARLADFNANLTQVAGLRDLIVTTLRNYGDKIKELEREKKGLEKRVKALEEQRQKEPGGERREGGFGGSAEYSSDFRPRAFTFED